MGLEPQDIRKLVDLRTKYTEGTSALILGDCDFHFGREFLVDLGVNRSLGPSPASLGDVASALNFSRLETVDLFGSPTIRFDLQSDDVPPELQGQFDWVIDAGTIFCCFNVAQVLRNVLRFLKPSGCVFHLAGLTGFFGRSYYAFSPMLFNDFYAQNGFEVIEMGVRVKPRLLEPARPRRLSFRSRLRSALRGLEDGAVPPNLDWRPIGRKESFLAAADSHDLRFTDTMQPDEPNVVPNNAVMMCFARRRECTPFRDAVPQYYSDKWARRVSGAETRQC
jgi:SAM-dependent methyltransferase